MIIQNTNMNIVFAPIEGIKKLFINNDEIVKECFNEPTLLPIPDNAPNEVPRIVMQSKGGHSQMALTKEVLSVVTNYDDNYNREWTKCSSNLKDKINVAYNLLESMDVHQYNFMGLVTTIIWDEITDSGSEYIYDNILNIKSNKNVFDASCKVTYVVDNTYYVNICIENIRLYQTNSNVTNQPGLLKNQKANSIGITIDVNDRYAFNNNEVYASRKDVKNRVIEITEQVISNIEMLIKEGEVNI